MYQVILRTGVRGTKKVEKQCCKVSWFSSHCSFDFCVISCVVSISNSLFLEPHSFHMHPFLRLGIFYQLLHWNCERSLYFRIKNKINGDMCDCSLFIPTSRTQIRTAEHWIKWPLGMNRQCERLTRNSCERLAPLHWAHRSKNERSVASRTIYRTARLVNDIAQIALPAHESHERIQRTNERSRPCVIRASRVAPN
jgi:hypothetical protein